MQKTSKNPLIEILVNIIIPMMILNKGGDYLGTNGPTKALIIALAFPAAYAIYDFKLNNNKNFISILGFVGLLFSGGFGLMQLGGEWFAIKEAGIPFIIGMVILISAYTTNPLISLLIYNDAVIQTDKVSEALKEKGNLEVFDIHLKRSTIFLSFSFFFSAVLNYVLAIRIFTEIPLTLSESERQDILNQQIADMTWLSYLVISVPSLLIMAAILWHLFKGIKVYTGLTITDVMRGED